MASLATLPFPFRPTTSMSMSLKQPCPFVLRRSNCFFVRSRMLDQESKMSPVDLHMWAPVVLIQLCDSSAPQLQAEKRMSRPQFARAMLILR